jgi:hypothetical protein
MATCYVVLGVCDATVGDGRKRIQSACMCLHSVFEAALQVEAVDPVFQTKMLEMLKQTGRPEMVVGALLLTPCAAAAKVLCS